MEFGDIIYFIMLIFFMIFGFFNDSRKKKKQQEQVEQEVATPPQLPKKKAYKEKPQAAYKEKPQPKRPTREFQPSSKQVADYRKYETGDIEDSMEFDYNADSLEEMDYRGLTHREVKESSFAPTGQRTSDGKKRGASHPLVSELYEEDGINALKKGIIFSEILQRKY